jgi:ABC-type multidrug transport system fused ATPase/permease subunit
MKILLRLSRYFTKHAFSLGLIFLLALCGVGFELAKPWPIKIVIDNVLSGRPFPAPVNHLIQYVPGASAKGGLLLWCVALAFFLVWISGVTAILVIESVMKVCHKLVAEVSIELFSKLQRLSLAYHNRHTVGDLIQRMSTDVFVVHTLVSQVLLPGAASMLSLLGMFVIMARIDLVLALVAMSVVPALVLSLGVFVRWMDRYNTLQADTQGRLMALVQQSLSGIRAIQGFTREAFVLSKIKHSAQELGEAYRGSVRAGAVYKEVTTALTGTAAAALIWLGANRVNAGHLSVGELWVFLGYLTALYGPVNNLTVAIGAGSQVISRGRRIIEVMDARDEVPERPNAMVLDRASGDVVFEGVAFGYCGNDGVPGRTILKDISLHARAGQITAIVGATGAGKTSLMSLLPRFFDPWGGRILIDGIDLRDLSLKSLRENIALVLQDPFLFAMTIQENIAFGRAGATHEEIMEAAKAAQAHDFIMRQPDQYNTIIGEGGVSLSGGEKQRISIARALLKDAPILILDEPTSSLDARTEAQIFKAITTAIKGRTTFIISHRLSTIRRADQIIAVEHGRIAESGTHESLLKENRVYAELYRYRGDTVESSALL